MYPKSLEKIIENMRRLPGVGEKTAERYALSLLDWSNEELESFVESLNERTKLHYCEKCGHITDQDECEICNDNQRDKSIICVVQNIKDVVAMEKIGSYHGLYHVLHGVISTSKGIMPNDLNIASLIERVNNEVKEVIIATNPTVEGETTALYLSKLLENKNVEVTRLAHGLPMGGHLDYADELTLIKALEGRKKI